MTTLDIGADIVENAGKPTKTVEEMKNLMGVSNGSESGTETVSGSESTTVKVESSEPATDFAFVVEPVSQTVSEPESNNTVFDATIHAVDSFGNPRRNQDGSYSKKKGRKKGHATEAKRGSQFESFTCAAPVSTITMVQMVLDSVTITLASVRGEKWNMTSDERASLTDAYARYIHYRGWDTMLTPEAFLIGVSLTYLMPRMMTEPYFQKLLGMKVNNAHADSGANRERKDHAGESNSTAGRASGNGGNNTRPHAVGGMGGTIEISSLRGSVNK